MIFDVQLPHTLLVHVQRVVAGRRLWASWLVFFACGGLHALGDNNSWRMWTLFDFQGQKIEHGSGLSLRRAVDYDVFQLQNPPRLVVDFDPVQWSIDRGNLVTQQGLVSAMRFGKHSDQKSRLVLDLTRSVESSFSFF